MSDEDLPKIVPMDDDVTWFDAAETRLRIFDEASEALSRLGLRGHFVCSTILQSSTE